MERIRNMTDLRYEKRRIRNEGVNIEAKIRENWDELKAHLQPKTLVKESFTTFVNDKTDQTINNESILKVTFVFGMSQLAKKFADVAEEKIGQFIRK